MERNTDKDGDHAPTDASGSPRVRRAFRGGPRRGADARRGRRGPSRRAPSLPGEPPQGKVTRTSRPVRLLRSWEEPVKVANGRETRAPRRSRLRLRRGRGVREFLHAFRHRARARRGSRRACRRPRPRRSPRPSSVVRNDPGLARLLARFHLVLEGGFVLEEGRGKPCGPGAPVPARAAAVVRPRRP